MGGTTSSYTYSPTPFGWGNGEQALKSPEDFPGGALNYVSGLCATFFPYKVGHLLRPVTHFKRTWSKFTHFHVAAYSIPQFRPPSAPFVHLRRLAREASHGPYRMPTNWSVLGVSKNWPAVNWPVWVCRKMAPANWSDSSVSKIYHSFSSNRRKPEDLRFSKTAPAAQGPTRELVKTGVTARRQLAGFEGVENLPQLPR